MTTDLSLISSMATRQLLSALADAWQLAGGARVKLEAVGGVDAARRVQAGEAVDVVVLASDAIAKLAAAGHVLPDSARDIVDSDVAIAVRQGSAAPDISSEAALRAAVLQARSIGYSTGPSGAALLLLFERWGLTETLKHRLIQARPGVPVGSLVASGEAELGFQQLSELMALPGISLLGGMPPGLEIVSRFVGAVAATSDQPDAARELLAFMAAPEHAALKLQHGMAAAV